VSVSNKVKDFLLGSDWLEQQGAQWDFALVELRPPFALELALGDKTPLPTPYRHLSPHCCSP